MELDYSRIRIQPIEGSGDISTGVIHDGLWMPLWIRGHWRRVPTTSGTETATLTIDVRSTRGQNYNTRLQTISAAGNGGDVKWRLLESDLIVGAYLMEPGDAVIVNWTNPDPDELIVGALFGWYPV